MFQIGESKSPLAQCAVVVASTTIAALIHFGLVLPFVGTPAPLLIFVLAILVSASYGGFWPGVAATFLSVALILWTNSGIVTEARIGDIARITMLTFGGLLASGLAGALHRARRDAEGEKLILQAEITNRRLAELKLAASDAEFRELAESIPDCMFTADADGRTVFANRRWLDFTASEPGGFIADWMTRVHPVEADRAAHDWNLALATGNPFESRFRLRGADDDYRWFFVRARPVAQGASGTRWFGVISDIDAQMRAESALRDREEQLRLALESTGLGIFEMEFWTRRTSWSDRCRSMWGFSPSETLTTAKIRAAIFPADRRRAFKTINRSRDPAGGGEFAFDLRVVHRDGGLRWIAIRGQSFFVETADGERAIRGIGTMLDITERRLADEAVRASEERQRLAIEATELGIWSFEYANRRATWSDRARAIFGFGPDELISRGLILARTYPADLPIAEEAERTLLDPQGPRRAAVDYRIVRRDGAVRWISFTGRAHFGADSALRPERLVGTMLDITDRKSSEQQLRRSEEQLREADRRKDVFLAVLAHELRNPLAPISSALEMMQRRPGDPAVIATARDVLDRQVSQMVRLIEDLLDVGRIAAGKLTLRRRRAEIGTVVESAVETVRPLIAANRHELRVSVQSPKLELNCDAARISQVLANLLNNSSKYTPPGGVITVEATVESEELRLSVRDNGTGIAPDALPRIFDMFAQAGGAAVEGHAGLGVGLPLARELVALHGGTIDAVSAGRGLGTEVTVRLPLKGEDIMQEAAAPKPDGQFDGQGPRKVLVVDDNRDAAESLAALLRLFGHEVEVGYDGAQAIALSERFRPHILLLDVGMPRMDGHEAARRVRAEAWGKSMHIVALSGFGQEQDRERSLEAGCNAHLIKPVSPEDLKKVIERSAL